MPRDRSPERSHIGPRSVRPFENFNVNDFGSLGRLGIDIPPNQVRQMMAGYQATMDALTPSVSTASIPTPIEFLRQWLPGFVQIVTAARKIDEFVGITTSGAWEDEEIVQGFLERLGTSVPYGDYTNVPLASWNAQYTTRTIVRFEEGMQVLRLEEARAARANINSANEKRASATLQLEIQRNNIGFNGYNSGDNSTYGLLNDPGSPNYVVLPNGAVSGTPMWSGKTYLEITKDIRTGIVAIRKASQDLIDPKKTKITLGVPTDAVDYLSTSTDFGYSVQKWLDETYPNVRVVSAPELELAHSSYGVMYMYAEEVDDMSTDDRRTYIQVVPTKFRVVGVQTLAKGYEEDYTNATAGILLKRPYALVRYYGISN